MVGVDDAEGPVASRVHIAAQRAGHLERLNGRGRFFITFFRGLMSRMCHPVTDHGGGAPSAPQVPQASPRP